MRHYVRYVKPHHIQIELGGVTRKFPVVRWQRGASLIKPVPIAIQLGHRGSKYWLAYATVWMEDSACRYYLAWDDPIRNTRARVESIPVCFWDLAPKEIISRHTANLTNIECYETVIQR